MACILHIETSTKVCSVAVTEDAHVIFEQADTDGPNHATRCGVFVDEALSFAESHAIPLDAVAVSEGPGSYTGLRIGVSMAKGVAYGRGVPLVAVPTLELLCVPLLLYRDDIPDEALFVPMIDARRMEVYDAQWLDRGPVYFFGDGAAKCKSVITHHNAHFIDDVVPLAKHMYPLAARALSRGETADVAYFEPFYLKDFVATKPKDLLKSL